MCSYWHNCKENRSRNFPTFLPARKSVQKERKVWRSVAWSAGLGTFSSATHAAAATDAAAAVRKIVPVGESTPPRRSQHALDEVRLMLDKAITSYLHRNDEWYAARCVHRAPLAHSRSLTSLIRPELSPRPCPSPLREDVSLRCYLSGI